MKPASRIALALASGVAWGLCFRHHADGVLPWVALAPWVVVLFDEGPGRSAQFLLGWTHGIATWLTAVYWISPVMVVHGGLPGPAGPVLLVLLALYLGLFHGLFALLVRVAFPRLRVGDGAARAVLLLPGLWLVLEWIRGWLFTGFPWNLTGYAIELVPGALPTAAWIGARGLGWLVLAFNVAVALAWVRRSVVPPLVVGLGIVVVLMLGSFLPTGVRPEGPPLDVRLVQPDIPIQSPYDPAVAFEYYTALMELADGLCTPARPLIVFAESAIWPYSWQSDARVRSDLVRLASPDCAVLFNTATWTDEETVYNSAALVGPAGLLGRYDKNHLVPWGEYVPLGDLIPFIDSIARAAGDFSAAEEMTLLDWQEQRLGVSICFEVIFPEQVARRAQNGATVLVTMTNDAWYGDTSAPWQHLRAARFRAAETRRPLLRAAITGVSAVFDAEAKPLATLTIGERGVIATRVQPMRGSTPYVRAPWLWAVLSSIAALFAIGFPPP